MDMYLEELGGLGVVLVDVGMVLLGQLVVALLDLLLGGVPGNAQRLVVIASRVG